MQNSLVVAPNGAICCKVWPKTVLGWGGAQIGERATPLHLGKSWGNPEENPGEILREILGKSWPREILGEILGESWGNPAGNPGEIPGGNPGGTLGILGNPYPNVFKCMQISSEHMRKCMLYRQMHNEMRNRRWRTQIHRTTKK